MDFVVVITYSANNFSSILQDWFFRGLFCWNHYWFRGWFSRCWFRCWFRCLFRCWFCCRRFHRGGFCWRTTDTAITIFGYWKQLTIPKLMAVHFPSLLNFDSLSRSELIHAVVLEVDERRERWDITIDIIGREFEMVSAFNKDQHQQEKHKDDGNRQTKNCNCILL